jgi:hypothetical protein
LRILESIFIMQGLRGTDENRTLSFVMTISEPDFCCESVSVHDFESIGTCLSLLEDRYLPFVMRGLDLDYLKIKLVNILTKKKKKLKIMLNTQTFFYFINSNHVVYSYLRLYVK